MNDNSITTLPSEISVLTNLHVLMVPKEGRGEERGEERTVGRERE
jgi:hypothetical protein